MGARPWADVYGRTSANPNGKDRTPMRTEWTPEQVSPTEPDGFDPGRIQDTELRAAYERGAAVAALDAEISAMQTSDRELERRAR